VPFRGKVSSCSTFLVAGKLVTRRCRAVVCSMYWVAVWNGRRWVFWSIAWEHVAIYSWQRIRNDKGYQASSSWGQIRCQKWTARSMFLGAHLNLSHDEIPPVRTCAEWQSPILHEGNESCEQGLSLAFTCGHRLASDRNCLAYFCMPPKNEIKWKMAPEARYPRGDQEQIQRNWNGTAAPVRKKCWILDLLLTTI